MIPSISGASINLSGFSSASGFPGPSTFSSPSWNSPSVTVDPDEDESVRVKTKLNELTLQNAKVAVQQLLTTDMVPFLWGPPGVGKSSLVREICAENNWKIIDLRLSLLNPVDLRGLPVIDKQTKIAEWFPPAFLPHKDSSDRGVLFLDEINLAPLSVQAAAYQLILDKKVGEYQLPKTWKIVAAGNREVDRANVYKISAPLANRFVHFTVYSDFYTWKAWAKGRICGEVLTFLTMRPVLLLQMPTDSQKAFPSPRTWEFVSTMMKAFAYDEDAGPSESLQQSIVGAIGEGTAKEFIAFLNSYRLRNVAEIVDQFIKTKNLTMPKGPSNRYAVIQAVFDAYKNRVITKDHYMILFDKCNGEEKATLTKCEAKYINE